MAENLLARLKELALKLLSLLNILCTQLRPNTDASAGCSLSSDISSARGEAMLYDGSGWLFPTGTPQ